MDDDTTLAQFQRSAYNLKPRKGKFKRFTPDDYTRRPRTIVDSDDEAPQSSALRRMRGNEEEVEVDDEDQEEQEEVVPPRKQAPKRGRGTRRSIRK